MEKILEKEYEKKTKYDNHLAKQLDDDESEYYRLKEL